jgi:hypothetical protein
MNTKLLTLVCLLLSVPWITTACEDPVVGDLGTPQFGGEVPPPPPPPPPVDGRMTGGGSVFTDDGMRVTHGFQLHCNAADPRQNLEINWHPGGEASSRWHLETLTFAECWDDPAYDPTPPEAPIDTYHGRGTGRYNGEAGATAEWTFTDQGEPGVNDRIVSLVIMDAAGNVVLTVDNKTLTFGNHQAHANTGTGPTG